MSTALQNIPFIHQMKQISSRRRRIVLLAFAIPITGALGLALFLPKSYRSTAVVVVERAGVADDDVDARLSVLKSENLSRSRLTALIKRFHLYQGVERFSSNETLIDQMQKDVVIELDKEERNGRSVAIAIRVTYTASDPRVAADVANDFATFYEREDLHMREQRAEQMRTKLQEQLVDARKRLDEQEGRLRDYKMRHLKELPEQVGLHLAALERLNSQIRASRIEPPRTPTKRDPSSGREIVTEAKRDERLDRLRELQLRYTAAHPDVKELKREIAASPHVREIPVRRPLDTHAMQESEAAMSTSSRVRAEGIRQRLSELQQTALEHEQGILNAPFRQQELEALLPDYVAARTGYQSLWERYEIAQLWDPRQDGGRLRVLDPAVPRDEAIAPNVPRMVAMGIALSLAAVVGMVVAVERMDTSFHTLDDLRSFTRVPVLASVPRFVTSTDKRRETRTSRRFLVLIVLLVAVMLAGAAYLSLGNQAFVTWMREGHP